MKSYLKADEIKLVYSGSHFFDVLERMIDECKEILHFQTYIFEIDETGTRVLNAMKRASQRKVQVYLLVDAYGSIPFPKEVADELIGFGINFRLYSPLLTSESMYVGRRLHHKVVVADKYSGLIGGINIADKYNTMVDAEAWLDYAVLCKGEICEYLHLLCHQFFNKKRMNVVNNWESKHNGDKNSDNTLKIRFRRNDWLQRQNEIHKSYVESLKSAEHSVFIVASYFLPGKQFRKLLKEATLRGVEIKIIMAGRSDISTLRLAENYLYDFYLRYNIKLYEWNNSVMHGKAMIVDDKWATIGSYNLNFLSHYISIELNADILDPTFIRKFSAHLNDIIGTCCDNVEMNVQKKTRGIFRQFRMWLAYNFFRLISGLALSGRKFRKRREHEARSLKAS
jgi:cardiolipin synthase A/B